jgi:hypothetical protein
MAADQRRSTPMERSLASRAGREAGALDEVSYYRRSFAFIGGQIGRPGLIQ